jgi:hypothetical protein
MTIGKKRWIYFILILINIPVGLGSREYATHLPYLIGKYGGDVFAASCIFFGVRFLFPRPALFKIAIACYLVCIAIETLQLYQAPWMQKLRHTPPFGILLGYGFLWSDWLCYLAGTLLALLIAYMVEK